MVSVFCRATEGSTQRAARWSTSILDQRRTHGGAAARVEQEDDYEPGLQDLRHPLQLAAHVRARQVRQEPQAGAAQERLHRRTSRRTEPKLRQQQQQSTFKQTPRQRRPLTTTSELRARHRLESHVQPLPARVLPRVPARIPDAAQHAASTPAERQSEGTVSVDADGSGLAVRSNERGGL